VTIPTLARRLGAFDATMLVMGGIIGSGIFINPYVVARHVHTTPLILGVWAAGGVIALMGAFVYAELAALRPDVGGQYAYLRDAWHPSVAFLYGWALLLVIQSGGMAAVAVTFARYTVELTGTGMPDWMLATLTLGILTLINCLGVRSGTNTQTALMLLKLAAIGMLIIAGLLLVPPAARTVAAAASSASLPLALAAAMTPVMFAYGGWQTASFMSGELVRPKRDLAIGLMAGVIGVIVVYLAVNAICLRTLGPTGLALTTTPATAVMRLALGETGAKLIAAGIAISTLGFLSQGMLTAPASTTPWPGMVSSSAPSPKSTPKPASPSSPSHCRASSPSSSPSPAPTNKSSATSSPSTSSSSDSPAWPSSSSAGECPPPPTSAPPATPSPPPSSPSPAGSSSSEPS